MRNFVKLHSRELAKSICHILMKVNHVIVANVHVANMSFNAIRENKILAKISEFTIVQTYIRHRTITECSIKI